MWSAHVPESGLFITDIDEAMSSLLKEVCETHLQQLSANAAAFANHQKTFEMTVQGCRYQNLSVSRYRVYCLECLRESFAALDSLAQARVREVLACPEADVLWQAEMPAVSGL